MSEQTRISKCLWTPIGVGVFKSACGREIHLAHECPSVAGVQFCPGCREIVYLKCNWRSLGPQKRKQVTNVNLLFGVAINQEEMASVVLQSKMFQESPL